MTRRNDSRPKYALPPRVRNYNRDMEKLRKADVYAERAENYRNMMIRTGDNTELQRLVDHNVRLYGTRLIEIGPHKITIEYASEATS